MINIDQLAAEYTAGATLRELAARYPYSHSRIGVLLEKAGVARRRKWGHLITCPTCRRPFRARQGRVHCSEACRRRRAA